MKIVHFQTCANQDIRKKAYKAAGQRWSYINLTWRNFKPSTMAEVTDWLCMKSVCFFELSLRWSNQTYALTRERLEFDKIKGLPFKLRLIETLADTLTEKEIYK